MLIPLNRSQTVEIMPMDWTELSLSPAPEVSSKLTNLFQENNDKIAGETLSCR